MKTRDSFRFSLSQCLLNVRRCMVWAVVCLPVCMLGAGIFARAQGPRIIGYEAPGAGTSAGFQPAPEPPRWRRYAPAPELLYGVIAWAAGMTLATILVAIPARAQSNRADYLFYKG